MIDYLEKFNNLPKKIKDQISTPEIIGYIIEIGKRYQINLATTVMRIMIKEIDIRNLANYFVSNFKFDQARAQHLDNELKGKVFVDVLYYLYRKDSLPTIANDGVSLTKNSNDYYDNRVDKIIEKSKLELSSQVLKDRLRKILLTYLKNIRDKLSAKDALTKSFENGGLGLDEASAGNILLLADDKIKKDEEVEIRPPVSSLILEDNKINLSRDIEYDLTKVIADKQAEKKSVLTPALKQKKQIAPPPPAIRRQLPKAKPLLNSTQPVQPRSILAKSVPKPAPKPVPKPKPVNNMQKTASGKIKMDDIQATPKVFTPVDELRYMTLKNFRNLDQNPIQAIVKIKQKLKVLQEEDYGKMVAGIKGWKRSPVNKLYLNIYQEGLSQGKSAQEILQKKKSNANALTEMEFDAIIKLNQELKF